jgi:ATP-dependent DNA helicase DinG
VLALLDNRLLKQRYGRTFIESLPPYKKTKDIAEVDEFFAPATTPETGMDQ